MSPCRLLWVVAADLGAGLRHEGLDIINTRWQRYRSRAAVLEPRYPEKPTSMTIARVVVVAVALLIFLAPSDGGADSIDEGRQAGDVLVPFPAGTVLPQAELWNYVDAELQRRLERRLKGLALDGAVRRKALSVALVDITHLDRPRVAAVNGDEMMYAASLPKIAILLAAFEQVAQGRLKLDARNEAMLMHMIRRSSNRAASAMVDQIGMEYIATVLQSPRYRLYDENRNGGLWIGKNYAQAGLWRRDPLHNLSHGATTMQVARFYYLLETGNLVSPEHSRRMKSILSQSEINHKFFLGIKQVYPYASVYRKSGTWQHWHADSAIIEHDGRRYIAVALAESPQGGEWLQRMIVAMDGLIFEPPAQQTAVRVSANATDPAGADDLMVSLPAPDAPFPSRGEGVWRTPGARRPRFSVSRWR
jgi:beta-lactamase class A